MATKEFIPQNTFSFGEVDPAVTARQDINAYAQALKTCRNWWLRAQGGIERRPGTFYLDSFFTGTYSALSDFIRMIPFEFDADERYMVLLIGGATTADSRIEVWSEAGALVDTVEAGTSPFTGAIAQEVNWAIAGDSIIIVHESMQPQILLRTSANNFTLSDLVFASATGGHPLWQPLYKYAPDEITMELSAYTVGSRTVTLSAPWFDPAVHVAGYILRYRDADLTITAFTDSTHVTADLETVPSATGATKDWKEQSWGAYGGFPRAVAFHNARLWFGGWPGRPGGLVSSNVNDYFLFDTGTGLDDESIDVDVIGGTGIPNIYHIQSSRTFQVFSSNGEFAVRTDASGAITPSNFAIFLQTPFGTTLKTQPQVIDGATLFVQRTGKAVREFVFTDGEDAYSSENISLLAAHLIDTPLYTAVLRGSLTRQEQLFFVVNSDGTLGVLNTVRSEGISGWTLWETDGHIENVAVLGETIWQIVERELGGASQLCLEFYAQDHLELTLDCAAVSTEGSPELVHSGFDHLDGETVSVVSGNFYMGEYDVSSGDITLDESQEREEIKAGLNYVPTIETLPIVGADQAGTYKGRLKRVISCVVDIYTALSIAVDGQELIVRQVTDDFSEDPEPIDGERVFYMRGYNRQGTVSMAQNIPLPCLLRGIVLEVKVS